MSKKEVNTDIWVASMLKENEIKYDAQGSTVKELDEALKTASKRGTGHAGYPEYVAVIDDFVLVVEDKADTLHCQGADFQRAGNSGKKETLVSGDGREHPDK